MAGTPLKFSIVTPSYNQGHFLEQTIDSVLSQKYPNLQYSIIDGGSTDASVSIIKKYEKHLHYWISEPDRGQTHAINKGYAVSDGAIFNWLNSDDYLMPGALREIADIFSSQQANVVMGRSRIFGEGYTDRYSQGTDWFPGDIAKTIGRARIDQPETFFRKEVLDPLFPLNEQLHYLMDKDLWIRFLLLHGDEGIVKTNNVWVNFRLHGQSKTVSLEEKFEAEHHHLLLHLVDSVLPEEYKPVLDQLFRPSLSIPLSFPTVDRKTLWGILQQYVLLQADRLYAKKEFEKSRLAFALLDSVYLKNDPNFRALNQRFVLPNAVLDIIHRIKALF